MEKKIGKKENKIILIFIITLVAVILIFKTFFTSATYKMELYVRDPKGIETNIRECISSTSKFECNQTYHECETEGNYYGRVLTYFNDSLIDDTGWKLIYVCSEQVGKTEKITEEITIESPLNQTYHAKNIILNVSTNETALWISDSFDNGKNVTECYNCTGYARFDLFFNNGVHSITVYASDNQTRISKDSVTFTVNI